MTFRTRLLTGRLRTWWWAVAMAFVAASSVAHAGTEIAVIALRVAEAPEADAVDPLFDDEFEAELAARRGFPDPLEEINRSMLALNKVIDRVLLDPLTRLYGFVMPDPVKPAMRRSFQHFAAGSVLLNDLLQLHPERGLATTGRFLVNTTVGLAGLFDFARCEGLGPHHADFGQTLALYGIGSGPYLVLPVFGPTTVRDAFGDVVDGLLHPARYFLGPAQQLTYGTGAGLSTREAYYQSLKELEKSSVDYYAALRNAFYQARMAEISKGVDYDIATPPRDRGGGPCTRTLAGHESRRVGPAVARGLAVEPVSRWNRSSGW